MARMVGYMPALPTPFLADGALDVPGFEQFCEYQISAGAAALVVCGTTGEAPTLSPDEQRDLIRRAALIARGRVPVIAGAGSNATARAVELARTAETAGADAILAVVPYYNKPTQPGLLAHFRAVAAAIGLPVILYDVPSRTVVGLADDTIARLAEDQKFAGLKDATGDTARLWRLRARLGSHFRLFSGDDVTAPAYLMQGGHGCISVTSNLIPGLCRALFLAIRDRQAGVAERLAAQVADATGCLFAETSPAPLKFALSRLGWMTPTLRLPLTQPGEKVRADVSAMLARLASGPSGQLGGAFGRVA